MSRRDPSLYCTLILIAIPGHQTNTTRMPSTKKVFPSQPLSCGFIAILTDSPIINRFRSCFPFRVSEFSNSCFKFFAKGQDYQVSTMFSISSQRLRQRLDDNKGARLIAASVCPLYAPSISTSSSRFATFLCPLARNTYRIICS